MNKETNTIPFDDIQFVKAMVPVIRAETKDEHECHCPSAINKMMDIVEKMISRLTPIPPKGDHPEVVQCPVCKKRIRSGIGFNGKAQTKFCDKCGQAIDWTTFNDKWDVHYEQHPNPNWDYEHKCYKHNGETK